MTVRKKISVALGITMLILLLLLDLIFTGVLRTASYQASKERMIRDLSRVVGLINAEAQTLSAISATWAYSDSTWHHLMGDNPNFVLPLFDRKNLKEVGISSIILLNKQLKVSLQKDYSTFNEPSSPESELSTIFSNPKNKEIMENISEGGISGIALRDNEPILFALKPILTSDMRGPIAGYLLATSPFNLEFTKKMVDNLNFNFTIVPTTEEEKTDPFIQDTVINKINHHNPLVSGRMLVKDHTGSPSFWVRASSPREDTSDVEKKMQLLFLAIAACVVLLCCGFDFVLKRILYDRIKRLQEEAEAIQEHPRTNEGITTDHFKDEITDLQRAITDVIAYKDYCCKKNIGIDEIRLMVYERFATHATHLCLKTLETVATTLTPGDEGFRSCITRKAKLTERFCHRLGIPHNELIFSYLGALFSKIGLISTPQKRDISAELTAEELREFQNYPLVSKDIMKSVDLLRSSTMIPYNWNENWDGTGFPNGKKGDCIPIEARAYAIVHEWSELSRLKPGIRTASPDEVKAALRTLKGTRLDPEMVEEFISMLEEKQDE